MFRRFWAAMLAVALLCSCALAEFSTDVEAINLIAQSTVVLENAEGIRSTGVVVGEGMILSEAIVSADPEALTVWTDSGDSLGVAAVIKNDPTTEIALSTLSGEIALPSIPLAGGGGLRRGETVTVIGSPLGRTCSVTTGTVGAVFEDRGVTWIQINAALVGSSSGALIDESGRMVGMLTSAYDDDAGAARGIYYAVCSESLPITIPEDTPVPTLAATPKPTEAPTASPTPKPSATPLPTPAPTHDPDNWVLVDNDDLRVEITEFLYEQYSSGSVYLSMYAIIENYSDHEINIYLNDAVINGKAVDSNGILWLPPKGTFTEEDDYFFFMPLEEGDSYAAAQLEDPRTISFEMQILDSDSYEDLYIIPITINGPEDFPKNTPAPTAVPTPMPFYPYLCKGDKNEDVRKMQVRLIALGYLSDSADGIYGNNTAQAVYDFRDRHDLLDTGDNYAADREMQAVLFSYQAKYYTEPYYGLVIPEVSYGEWKELSNDILSIRVQVKNITKTQTIKAFELYMYATDVYGDRIYGSDIVYYDTTTKSIGPGKTVYSDYINLPDRSSIDKVYVAIKKMVYSDGTVRTVYDPTYDSWTIK